MSIYGTGQTKVNKVESVLESPRKKEIEQRTHRVREELGYCSISVEGVSAGVAAQARNKELYWVRRACL